MEKKQIITTIWGREFTLTVSEDLNKIKGKINDPKLEETNKTLAKIKKWPPGFFKK